MNRPGVLEALAFIPLWLYIFSLPSEKSVEIPGFGTASKLFGALSIGAYLFLVMARARMRLPAPAHLAAIGFVIWSAATYCWSASPAGTAEQIGTYVNLLALLLFTWQVVTTETWLHLLLDAYVAGTAVPALDTVKRFLAGQQTFYLRYASAGFDPNDLALTLALSLPVSYYLSLVRTGPVRWLYRLQMLAAAGTILLTGSRGGTVSMVIGLSLVVTTIRLVGVPQRLLLAGVALASLFGAAALVPAASFSRIATLGSEVQQGTLNSRTLLWQAGWRAFEDVPLHGIGSGAYPEIMARVIGRPWDFEAVAHNSFLSVLIETGLIGFGLFAAWLSLLVLSIGRMPFLQRRLWWTTLAVWTTGVSALTWEYRKPTWMIFGFLTAHAATYASASTAGSRARDQWPVKTAWKAGSA